MFVLPVIEEVSQALMHTRVVLLPQMSCLNVFGDVLTEETSTRAARGRAVAFGKGR
jgi:hypothetical protein